MKFRYTMEELQKKSDYEMLRCIILDRQSDCTNIYSPLYKRLQQLYQKLQDKTELTKKDIS